MISKVIVQSLPEFLLLWSRLLLDPDMILVLYKVNFFLAFTTLFSSVFI